MMAIFAGGRAAALELQRREPPLGVRNVVEFWPMLNALGYVLVVRRYVAAARRLQLTALPVSETAG